MLYVLKRKRELLKMERRLKKNQGEVSFDPNVITTSVHSHTFTKGKRPRCYPFCFCHSLLFSP